MRRSILTILFIFILFIPGCGKKDFHAPYESIVYHGSDYEEEISKWTKGNTVSLQREHNISCQFFGAYTGEDYKIRVNLTPSNEPLTTLCMKNISCHGYVVADDVAVQTTESGERICYITIPKSKLEEHEIAGPDQIEMLMELWHNDETEPSDSWIISIAPFGSLFTNDITDFDGSVVVEDVHFQLSGLNYLGGEDYCGVLLNVYNDTQRWVVLRFLEDERVGRYQQDFLVAPNAAYYQGVTIGKANIYRIVSSDDVVRFEIYDFETNELLGKGRKRIFTMIDVDEFFAEYIETLPAGTYYTGYRYPVNGAYLLYVADRVAPVFTDDRMHPVSMSVYTILDGVYQKVGNLTSEAGNTIKIDNEGFYVLEDTSCSRYKFDINAGTLYLDKTETFNPNEESGELVERYRDGHEISMDFKAD